MDFKIFFWRFIEVKQTILEVSTEKNPDQNRMKNKNSISITNICNFPVFLSGARTITTSILCAGLLSIIFREIGQQHQK
jgi:hypothetical protein